MGIYESGKRLLGIELIYREREGGFVYVFVKYFFTN